MPSFLKKRDRIKTVGALRKSKIVHNAGCGALVDFPGFTGIMGGQNLWFGTHPNHMKIYEKRLEDQLGKEYFLQVINEDYDNSTKHQPYKIPVIRFPQYYYCPQCHALDYAKKLSSNYGNDKNKIEPLKCNNCKKELIPSRFVVACEDGHIDEFPYDWWVHRGKKCEKPMLELRYKGTTGGLESIEISCKFCKKQRTMSNVMSKEGTLGLACLGKRPWLQDERQIVCEKTARVLLRGSSNIYYPEVITALTIPPWSNAIQKYIDEKYDTIKTRLDPSIPKDLQNTLLDKCYDDLAAESTLNFSKEDFAKQARLRFEPNKDQTKSMNLDLDEYKAFVGEDMNDRDFKTQSSAIPESLQPLIKKIKLVKRLREVKVLSSFKRVIAYEGEGGTSAHISKKSEKWLPAVELLGEGIFFEFDYDVLNIWSEKVKNHYNKMMERFIKERQILKENFTVPKVGIHTFSHLLMRELAYNCGYELASITEKLYVSDEQNEEMSGLLIYTASTSSDGSLGGLVRQGEISRLNDTVASMLNRAIWCSNDPICIESTNQGWKSLNYAACHACSLVPEISCKYHNIMLDRRSIVGTIDDRSQGLLGGLLE